jgi:hypothetical protein
MPFSGIISWLSDVSTIFGFIIAVVIYFLWRRNYTIQLAHEYALGLLKKMKYLHLEIDLLRRAKFYYPETVIEDIEKIYIPQIEEKILKKIIEIQVDLLVASESLVKHKKLQSKFNETIIKNVIHYITIEVHLFFSEKKSSSFDVKKSGLFKVIFPSESRVSGVKLKVMKSTLGTGFEIIDDEFNEIIQNNFASIYADLEENLASNTFAKSIKKFFKSFCHHD